MSLPSFDEWYARPTLCRECGEPVSSDDVDIDEEGRTVGTCAACRADEAPATRAQIELAAAWTGVDADVLERAVRQDEADAARART